MIMLELFKEKLKTLNKDQRDMFRILRNENLYQFRVPTGVGKGYITILHIMDQIINSDKSTFVIASHRLSLNNQHLSDIIQSVIELELVDQIQFLTIGSDSLDMDNFKENLDEDIKKKFYEELFLKDISPDEISKQTLRNDEAKKFIHGSDKKTIILSTYHSLDKLKDIDIDTIYLDEAHILANENEEAKFQSNFASITAEKKFFFTATPKDLNEDEKYLDNEDKRLDKLMCNEDTYGPAYNLSFRHCVEMGYIVKPTVHIAHPSNIDYMKKFDSPENKAIFIKEAFNAHGKWINSKSSNPDLIEPKLLVRCDSVPSMWDIKEELDKLIKESGEDIIICAGASYNDSRDETMVIGDKWYKNNQRDHFLKDLQSIAQNQRVIILHFDILSEGINVSGITGVMFMQERPPSKSKTIQTIGRATRLHKFDRDRIFDKELDTTSYLDWVKPYCSVILPWWDKESEMTKNFLSSRVKELRDDFGFDPSLYLSIGDDMGNGEDDVDIEGLNKLDKKKRRFDLIKDIENNIEELDKEDLDNLIDKEYQKLQDDYIKDPSKFDEWLKFENLHSEGKIDLNYFR